MVRYTSFPGTVYGPKAVVKRARSRIGQRGYSLLYNNCEHFATWCKTGQHCSVQAEGGKIVSGVVGKIVETLVYEDECSCGATIDGLAEQWLCRKCGRKSCRACISKDEESLFSTIGKALIKTTILGNKDLFDSYRCSCGNILDSEQKIR